MYRLERILLLKSVCRQLKSTSLTSSSSSSQFIVTRSVSSEILHTIPGLVQSCVVWWHTSTGLPWWATFATSTLIARSALIPLVVHQRKSADKMAGAMPEINFLYQALRIRVLGFRQLSWEKRLRTLTVFFKGARSALAMHDVRLRSLLGVPILNASLFITVIYSIREMVARDVTPDIMEGGLLWFTDLSEKDPNLALPLIALGLSYLSLDLSLPEHGRILRSIKDFLQSLLLVSTPYVMLLPTGVFCYWIPSSLFMIAQVRALKIPEVRKFLGIPNDHIPEHLRAP